VTAISHPEHAQTSGRIYRSLVHLRSRYVLLQSLVSIVLSYEMLFGPGAMTHDVMRHGLVVGLWVLVAVISGLPAVLLETAQFSGALVAIDTVLVAGGIYYSGNARPDLYISYFVLMLVAASVRRLSHLLGLSLLLSLGYAAVLYEATVESGTLSVGHLLGVPVLLVMAVFYGVALETIAVEREQKSALQRHVDALKKTEDHLLAEKGRLEERIAALKQDLAQAHTHLREGVAARHGLERQLRDAQKMEAVGRIAAGIAGEFGALFSMIGRHTGLLLSQMKPEDPRRASVEEIFKTGEKAASLTAELIALNLDRAPVRHVVSVKTVLTGLQSAMTSLLPSSIDLRVLLPDHPVHAEVDREGLEQVLLQLVVNARDAMPAGGTLSIGASIVSGAADRSGRAARVLITVTDTGTGMNLDTQARMFEPFFSTKETHIGLGLTAVYGIVTHNGGALDVESRPGQGTAVRVFFPAAPDADARGESLSTGLLAKGDETILLVEEDEIDRKLALSALERHRYHVLEAASSTEALMLTQQHQGSLHLAISPLLMPDMGGRELARRLLSRHPTMKALFISGYDDDTIQHHRINRKYVLQQPYRRSGLIEKVRDMLDAA
jgi:signal transduction histidine kinase/CheY-like chemotaxis protein